jgi:molecular chaperone HscA
MAVGTGVAILFLEENKEFSQQIRLEAEKAKKTLSGSGAYTCELNGQTLEISRQQFDELIRPLVDRTLACCANAVKDAGIDIRDIKTVVMAGGSTRVPFVKQSVSAFRGQPVFDNI